MMKKRNVLFSLILIIFLFQACQQSPTQTSDSIENSLKTQKNALDGALNNFDDPEGFGYLDECLEDPTDPFNVIIECDDPGGGNTGPGTSTIPANRFQYVNRGNWYKNLYTSYSADGIGGWSVNKNFSGQASGAKSNNGPAVIKYNNNLYAYYRGASGKDIFYAYTSNGSNWSGNNHLISGAKSNYSPVSAVHHYVDVNGQQRKRIHVYYVEENWNVPRVSISNDGINYTLNTRIKDDDNIDITCCGELDEAIGVASLNNQIYFFYRYGPLNSNPGSIYYRTSPDGITFSAEKILALEWPLANSGFATAVHNGKIYLAFSEMYEPNPPTPTNQNYGPFSNRLIVLRLGAGGGGGFDGELSAPGYFGGTNGDIDFTPFFTNETPGLATDGNKLVVTYKDMNEDIRSFYYLDNSFSGSSISGFSQTIGLGYRSQSVLASGKTEGGIGLVYTGN